MFLVPNNPFSLTQVFTPSFSNFSSPVTHSAPIQKIHNIAIDHIVDPKCPNLLRKFLIDNLSTQNGEFCISNQIPQEALGTKQTFLWGSIAYISETALGKVVRSVRDIFMGTTNTVLSKAISLEDLQSAELEIDNSEWGEFCLKGVLSGAALSLLAQDSTPLLAGIALGCGPPAVTAKLIPDYEFPLGSYALNANLSNIFGQNYTGNIFQSKGGNLPTSYLFGPQYISSVAAPGPIATVTANGSTIYGAFGSAGSGQINYQNPYLPQMTQLIANVQSDRLVSPYGSYLAMARGNLGAYLFNCQPSCSLVSSFNTAGICVAAFATEVSGIGIVFHIGDSAAGYSTLSMYPAAPALLSNYNSPGSAVHLAFIGTTTIVADASSVIAVDASNVSALSHMFTFPVAGGTVSCVAIHNGNVFATAGPQGLLALGFSTTSGFKLLGRYDNIGWAQWITFKEGTDVAFLTDATTGAGFHVITTTPLELIRSIAISPLPGLPQGIANIGDYTIMADGSSNNLALTTKLHDPKVPSSSGTSALSQRGKYDLRIEAIDGYTSQTAQFTVTFSTEVKVKNTPASISVPLNTRGTTLFDPKQLFYFSGSVGILNLAFSDPKTSSFTFQPNIASGSYDTGSSILSLATSGTVVISIGAGQIRYLDATTQTLLTPLRILTTGGSTRKVAVTASKLALIADGFSGVRIDKFTTPTSATTVGTWSQIPGFARDVTLMGSVGFFTYDALGVIAIQFADSTAPYLLSLFNTTATPQAIGTDGQLIYTTTLQGLEIINYQKNVSQPERLSYLPLSNIPDTISINNGRAYLTTGFAQITIVDLANSTNPFVQYIVKTQARAVSTAIYENLLFVSMSTLGVEVFNIKNAPSSVLLIPTTYGAGPIVFLNGQPLISDGTSIKSLDLSQLTYTLDVAANLTNAGTYTGILTCIDDLGNSITSSVSLRTEAGPIATGPLLPVTAFVGQAFSWVVPSIIQDPNKDVVSYLISTIPWAVSSSTGVVQGTPSLADVGLRNVSITVSDGHNGELTLFLPLTVKVPPYGAKQIPSQLVDINTASIIKIDPTAITSPSGDPLQYSLTLSNGQPLPPELIFNPVTLQCSVFTALEKSYELALSGKTADGGATTLTFKITASSFPKFQMLITPPLIPRGTGLTYQLPDPKQLVSSLHTPLSFQLEVSDSAGTILPSGAVSFNSLTQQISFNIKDEPGPLLAKLTVTDALNAKATTTFPLTTDYFPERNPQYILSDVPINYGTTLNIDLPKDFYIDRDDNLDKLVISLTGPSGASLANNRIVWDASKLGAELFKLTVKDPKGGSRSDSFIANVFPFPVGNNLSPPPPAKIGESFKYSLPPSTFSSATGLSYAVYNLPSWLKWDPVKKELSGTPAPSDQGESSVIFQATDQNGGTANITLPILATYVIENPEPIPDMTVRASVPFELPIKNTTIVNKSGRNTTVELNSKIVTFDNRTFKIGGTVNQTGVFPLTLHAKDSVSNISLGFNLNVEANKPPKFFTSPEIKLASTGDTLSMVLPRLTDPEGDSLTMELSMGNGESLPSWIEASFNTELNTITISGEVPQTATSWFSPYTPPAEMIFLVTVTDKYGANMQESIRMMVGGDSILVTVTQYLGIVATIFTVYELKNFIRRHLGKTSFGQKCLGINYVTGPANAPFYEHTTIPLNTLTERITFTSNGSQELPAEKMFEKSVFFDPISRSLKLFPQEPYHHSGLYKVRGYYDKWTIGPVSFWQDYLVQEFPLTIGEPPPRLDIKPKDEKGIHP